MKRWLVLLILCVPAVAAHAQITSSQPPDQARLLAPPDEVSLVLTQPVEVGSVELTVTDHTGTRADDGDVAATGGDRPTVRVGLRDGIGDGAYTIRLTATSLSDGHRVTYTRGFAVGGFEPPAAGTEGGFDPAGFAGRVVLYAGLATALGAAMMHIVVPASRADGVWRLFLRAGAGAHAAGAAIVLLAARADGGVGLAAFLATPTGTAHALRLAGASLALVPAWIAAPPDPSRAARASPAAGCTAALLLASAAAGARLSHASGLRAVAGDLVHVAAAAAWAGGLAVLAAILWRGRADAAAVGRRFSTFATVCVTLIVLTGVAGAAAIVPHAWTRPAVLWRDPWGRALLAKVALLVAMLGLAALNRRRLVRSVPRDGVPPGAPRGVAAEASLGALVLVLAAVLTTASPPADLAPEPLTIAQAGDDVLVTLQISPEPAAGGSSQLRLHLRYTPGHASGETDISTNTCAEGRTDCVQVRVLYGDDSADVVAAVPEGDGWWHVDAVWQQAGNATVETTVQTEHVFRDTVTFALVVREG